MRDVTLRDGLQLTGKVLGTATKVELARRLWRFGVPAVEIGSMARGDLVPSVADTLDVVDALTPEELARSWVWVATPRHVERVLERGTPHFQFCFSVSESHNRANLGRSVEESLDSMPRAVELATAAGASVQLCLATSFTCPFEGAVPADRVIEIANDPRTHGAADIVVCDTLGQSDPATVASLVGRVTRESPVRRIAFHGHDTWGLGIANTLAAIGAGAELVDATLGALGGCPFAPGASGNTSLEDLVFALKPSWLTRETHTELVATGVALLDELGEDNRSRTLEAMAVSPSPVPWPQG